MEFTGKTVQEAVENGLKELGLTEDKAVWKVLEEPTKGILGIGAKKAKIELSAKKSDSKEKRISIRTVNPNISLTSCRRKKKTK